MRYVNSFNPLKDPEYLEYRRYIIYIKKLLEAPYMSLLYPCVYQELHGGRESFRSHEPIMNCQLLVFTNLQCVIEALHGLCDQLQHLEYRNLEY